MAFVLLGGGFIEFWAMRVFLYEKYGASWELRHGTRLPSIMIDAPGTLLRRAASKIFLSSKARSRIRLCSDELLAGRPIALNLENTDRKKAFEVPQGEKELAFLAERVPNALVIPVVFVWRRKRSILHQESDLGQKIIRGLLAPIKFPRDVLLGDPTHPTMIRKLFILLRQYERSTLRLIEPVEINSAPVKMLRRKILTSILQEKKVILGPVLNSPRFIGENILRSASFLRIVRTVAAEQEVSELSLLKKSQRYFGEISANFGYFTIELFSWVLSWIFSRIFNRLTHNEEEFEKLRLIAREGPLLILPSHKSYFDFLIMSYLLFREEIAPPHIAAGINLNFWPFGHFAKGAGAFFIRRSFRGNVLYIEVLRRYVAALLQGRSNVEFFLEGARSRNGKMAPPKFGMLKMVVDSYYEGLIQEKIRIIPISINYERVTEANAHRRELEGGEKVQESVVGLVKSSTVLFRKYGEVNVRVAEPIAMEEWLEKNIGDFSSSNDARKLGVQKLAFEVCHRINRATPIPPTGLVCALLLAKPGAALPKSEFEAWLLRIQEDLKRMNVLLAESLSYDYLRACRRALAALMEDGIIEKYHTPNGKTGLRVPHKQRVAALYYRNSAIHALLSAGVAGFAKNSNDELLELRAFLQFEFFFPEKELFLLSILHVPQEVMTELYARMLDDVFENIELGLRALLEMQGHSFDEKEWKNRFMKFGRAAGLESSVTHLEAVNTQGFAAFIEMAKNKKWLIVSAKEKQYQPSAPTELTKALNRVGHFRGRLPTWDALKEKYLKEPLNEEAEIPAESGA